MIQSNRIFIKIVSSLRDSIANWPVVWLNDGAEREKLWGELLKLNIGRASDLLGVILF